MPAAPRALVPAATGVALLALLVGCPSKSGGKGAEAAPVPAPQAPSVAAPVAPAPAAAATVPAPASSSRPRPAKPAARVAAPGSASVPAAKAGPAPVPAAKAADPAPVVAPAPAAAPAPVPAPVPEPAPLPAPSAVATASTAVPVSAPVAPAPGTAAPGPASPVPAAAPVTPIAPRAAAPPTTPPVPKAEGAAKASYRRLVASYGAQMGLATPTNGGLRLAAGGPSAALGFHATLDLPKGLRLRPRLDYTVFAGETRSSTAGPLPQSLDTKVSSLALGADFLVLLGARWSLGLAVSELRWSVASTNTVTPTLGGSMSLSGTSHWTRLGYGPVLTFKVSDHLELEGRALSSHYGYENQLASTATLGLLWRF